MGKALKDIAAAIDGEIIGNENLIINGVCGIKEAQDGDITFLANLKYKPFIRITRASAIITSKDIKSSKKTIIHTENPSLAFTKVISMFMPQGVKHFSGINKMATISDNVDIAKGASVGANSFLEEGVAADEGVVIYPNCYIGKNVKIGKDTIIYPNVTIREGTIIGKGVIIHSGSVIGSDGFGYVEVDSVYCKIPQVGIVIIEDDVEIGANVTIDRARFGQTIIGEGTKIDNLVHIAHNVKIGTNSVIVAQSGISGSATLGKNTILAGQSALVGHIELGDNVTVGPRSAVTKSFPANSIILGAPAKPITQQKKIFACISKLPELFNTLKIIKKKLNISYEETKDDKKTS